MLRSKAFYPFGSLRYIVPASGAVCEAMHALVGLASNEGGVLESASVETTMLNFSSEKNERHFWNN